MRVKVGNTITDGKYQPIMVILTKQDKINIANMDEEATKYCLYPANISLQEIKKWVSEVS